MLPLSDIEKVYSTEIRAKHCEPDDEIDFGERYLRWAEDFKNKKLIAEYSTWQEAVNSPEFKGEKHD